MFNRNMLKTPENINFYLCSFGSHILARNSLNFSECLYWFVVSALQISVRFFTTLREITGKKEETLKFKNKQPVTISLVLDVLAKRHGKGFVEYVFYRKGGQVKGFLQFLVNGRSASTFGGLEARLSDGDVLAIIPPVGGG